MPPSKMTKEAAKKDQPDATDIKTMDDLLAAWLAGRKPLHSSWKEE